ncbi:hypothetical protein GCK72_014452 [Caenorhabditis remanei]|uniref:LIM zinc-binding domain-containing protein n=1 Tax=Caenorhabditis remanei TaxID=31234 RepID=A0A6A5GTJ2_CAERE|nr:hypothetical protein GCK72_014452 [Caenorhabditis remanei]KAF1757994.1 hypothetical protein GCK72_014452 [Caenorhabditis remanei]
MTTSAKITEQRNSGKRNRCCERCKDQFELDEPYFLLGSASWHMRCFLCAQCMEPLVATTYFQFENRIYCEHDFKTLYAPVCAKCNEFVIGQVVHSSNYSFHFACFTCDDCDTQLNSHGAYRYHGKILCFSCNQKMPKLKIYNCTKCKQRVEDEDLLMYQHEPYHAYHFKCTTCKKVLEVDARTVKDELFCPRCFDFQCEVCFDCKKAIDPQIEQSLFTMNKHWHIHHFRCATCSRPFNGHEHYEKNGKAYCRDDFLELIGHHCFICDKNVAGAMVHVFGKAFCPDCYRCRGCDKILHYKDKVMELDLMPLCKKCIGHKNFQKSLKYKSI